MTLVLQRRSLQTRVFSSLVVSLAAACSPSSAPAPAADLILHNARAYTLAWPEPATDGRPSHESPYDSTTGWASAIAIRDGHADLRWIHNQ